MLAFNGYYVPVGKSIAHIKRTEYLLRLRDLKPEFKNIIDQYLKFKDFLYGNCFYTALDPIIFKDVINEVEPFLKLIESSITG